VPPVPSGGRCLRISAPGGAHKARCVTEAVISTRSATSRAAARIWCGRGWHRVHLHVTKPSGKHTAAAPRHATEVIWSNRPVASDLPCSCAGPTSKIPEATGGRSRPRQRPTDYMSRASPVSWHAVSCAGSTRRANASSTSESRGREIYVTTTDDIDSALARRLPSMDLDARRRLATAYLDAAVQHAAERTVGTGPIPTTLSAERAALIAYVSRKFERLLSEDEISALLRIPTSTARSVRRTMLAVYDDLPNLALKAAFTRAVRDGRGSQGEVKDGYRVKFSTRENMQITFSELQRQGYLCEVMESTGSRHVLLIDSSFPISQALPDSRGR
jgi:hypothetical protein